MCQNDIGEKANNEDPNQTANKIQHCLLRPTVTSQYLEFLWYYFEHTAHLYSNGTEYGF